MKRSLALSLPMMALLAAPAWSDNHDPHATHGEHDYMRGQTPPAGPESDATKAFKEANAKMHEGMIPHHQGAIDMAEIVLKYGKDPETKKLAEEIIKAQTAEITFMKEWLAKHGK